MQEGAVRHLNSQLHDMSLSISNRTHQITQAYVSAQQSIASMYDPATFREPRPPVGEILSVMGQDLYSVRRLVQGCDETEDQDSLYRHTLPSEFGDIIEAHAHIHTLMTEFEQLRCTLSECQRQMTVLDMSMSNVMQSSNTLRRLLFYAKVRRSTASATVAAELQPARPSSRKSTGDSLSTRDPDTPRDERIRSADTCVLCMERYPTHANDPQVCQCGFLLDEQCYLEHCWEAEKKGNRPTCIQCRASYSPYNAAVRIDTTKKHNETDGTM